MGHVNFVAFVSYHIDGIINAFIIIKISAIFSRFSRVPKFGTHLVPIKKYMHKKHWKAELSPRLHKNDFTFTLIINFPRKSLIVSILCQMILGN